MNKDVVVEARPRPHSTGLWTLFSWLRRDDRSSSSESLSSAGSDRTAASFAFLAPAHYEIPSDPLILPPPGPPSDTYKKRVHDRNIRRQYDRDLTLHRKYGLFKSEIGSSYDAFSLPPVRRINGDCSSKRDRERRAASECLQRRAVHVPGKRRAPAPPVVGSSNSLPRRHSRKRPAPQPPGKFLALNKEHHKNLDSLKTILTQMNSDAVPNKQKSGSNDVMMGCKSEKYSKKEAPKEVKLRREKSFLKQIFDNKKRHSAIDTSSIKVLPSISELDKQAAEIIEACKTNPSEHNNNVKNVLLGANDSKKSDQAGTWFCVSCLRKYNSTIVTCLYCVPKQKIQAVDKVKDSKNVTSKASNSYTQTEKELSNTASTSNDRPPDDKQKLKEMLKEMKDSLPKRPRHDQKEMKKQINVVEKPPFTSTETPTLRVGSTQQANKPAVVVDQSAALSVMKILGTTPVTAVPKKHRTPTTSVLATKQVVVTHNPNSEQDKPQMRNKDEMNKESETKHRVISNQPKPNLSEAIKAIKESDETSPNKSTFHTPLKISSLLNPVYVPKLPVSQNSTQKVLNVVQEPQTPKIEVKTAITITNSSSHNTNVTQSNHTPSLTSASLLTAAPNQITKKVDSTTNTSSQVTSLKNNTPLEKQKITDRVVPENKANENIQRNSMFATPSTSKEYKVNGIESQDQHSKRRDLINQLEQSIAKGDESAAAEAAAKLAQLRLSCSVLSFSSQILSQASTSGNVIANAKKQDFKPNVTPPKQIEQNQIKQTKNQSPQMAPKLITEKVSPTIPVNAAKPNLELINKTTMAPLIPSANIQVKPLDRKDEVSKEKNVLLNEATTSKQVAHNNNQINMISIAVLVEDREATRGPVHLVIQRQAKIRDLRREAETSLGLATNLQRWIIGRTLCTDDNTPVASLAGLDFSAPFYLCLVESETKINTLPRPIAAVTNDNLKQTQDKAGNVYSELVELEQQAFVPNTENFECGVCIEEYGPGRGVVLRDCVHIFCKDCLTDVVRHCEEPDVPCPAMGCRGILQEREIRAIVTPEDYERWLARGLAAAESGTRNAFHCRTKDCKGWALCEPGVQRFPCPVCKCINCVPCQAIHDGVTCTAYQAKLKEAASTSSGGNQADDGTRTLLNSLISKGEALECPECKAIITKKWGCDWVKCSACKTEICWVTRGRRWGPAGRGDTSGGCRCGVDGKRCHPSCGYCH